MKKFFVHFCSIFLIFMGFLWCTNSVFAEENNKISKFTGETTDLDFTLSEKILSILEKKQPIWNETTNKISGDFYINGVGFANLNSANISCGANNCMISGQIFAKSIGNMTIFATFLKNNKVLAGQIISENLWTEYNLSGIRLSNSAININELGNLTADKNATLTLDDDSISEAFLTTKYHSIPKSYEFRDKKFENVDLSKSGDYEFILTIDDKEYKFTDIVKPAEADGQKSTVEISPSPLVAWPESQNLQVILKDIYGNEIKGGNVKIFFEIEDKNAEDQKFFADISKKDGKIYKNIDDYSPARTFPFQLLSAPESLKITKITHNDEEITNFGHINLNPKNPITAEIIEPKLTVGQNTTFEINYIKNKELPNAFIIGVFDGDSEIKHLSNPCDITNLCSKFSGKTFILPAGNKNSFNLTVGDSNSENIPVNLKTYIAYPNNGDWVIYKNWEKTLNFQKDTVENLVFMGNSGAGTSSENIAKNPQLRANLLNQIRKNVAYLTRNGNISANNFDIVSDSDNTISSLAKRSYIATSGDIIINSNIAAGSELEAIIALDGNIKIAPTVTEIHATLIAGKSIISTDENNKSYQLFIFGSTIANNVSEDSFVKMRENFDNSDDNKKSPTAKILQINDKIIIRHNPNIINNPPPGLENFRE